MERHRRLEALPSQLRLMARDFDMMAYRSALLRLHGFYAPLAAAFAQDAPALFASLRLGPRVEALRHDLFDLGYTSADLDAAPLSASLPALGTFDFALGCAYVIAGSGLGGRVIFKHVSLRADAVPLRFFAGDGDQTANVWSRFCAQLNAEVTRVDEACAGACATFDGLISWLDEPACAATPPRR